MHKRIVNSKTWIWVALLIILVLGARYLITQAELKEYPMYVSESPSPTGTKAFFTYLSNHNNVVKRWSNSPSQLPNDQENKILLMVEPFFVPNKNDINSYGKFMESGNTIILFKNNPKGMFGLETEFVEGDEDLRIIDSKDHNYQVASSSPVRLQALNTDEILLTDEVGIVALKRSFGHGQLIVVNEPDWLTNKDILKEDHLSLILELFNEVETDEFLFDEYINGEKNAATIFTVYPLWFLLFIVQAIIVSIFWLWSRGKRFGAIYISREESVRFSDEAISAIAAWYIRGNRYLDALSIQSDYVKTSVQERWRIPVQEEWRDLTEHFEHKSINISQQELSSWLIDLSATLKKSHISKQEFLLWSKRLERIRKEVES